MEINQYFILSTLVECRKIRQELTLVEAKNTSFLNRYDKRWFHFKKNGLEKLHVSWHRNSCCFFKSGGNSCFYMQIICRMLPYDMPHVILQYVMQANRWIHKLSTPTSRFTMCNIDEGENEFSWTTPRHEPMPLCYTNMQHILNCTLQYYSERT